MTASSDLLEISMQVYSSDSEPTQLRLVLCGGDAATEAGHFVETNLPSRNWQTIALPLARFSRDGKPDAAQQINAIQALGRGAITCGAMRRTQAWRCASFFSCLCGH